MDEEEQGKPSRKRTRRRGRSGQGDVTSATAAKDSLGRGFIRTRHEGRKANPTEFKTFRLFRGKGPTQTEIKQVLRSNPSGTNMWRGLGCSDKEIYQQLKDR